MKKKLKRYELKIDPTSMDKFYNSLVERPAIEENFIAFNSDQDILYFKNEEKRMVTGPIMIPDKSIIRRSKDGYYEVYFTRESIQDIVKLTSKSNRFNSTKTNHSSEVEGVTLVESWLVGEEGDKIYSDFGFTNSDIPAGSWVGTYFIENDEIWDKVKQGRFNGFSVEGNFIMEEQFAINDVQIVVPPEIQAEYNSPSELNDDELIKMLKSIQISDDSDEDKLNKIIELLK